MSLVATEARLAGTGELYISKVGAGASAPSGVSTSLTGYTGLGYTTDDGVAFNFTIDTERVTGWQSANPLRYIPVAQELTLSATFLQSNADVVGAWLGVDFAANGVNEWKAALSTIPALQEYEVVVHWEDGSNKTRLYVPRAMITDRGQVQLQRTSATGYQLTFSAMAPDSGDLADWFTDDPNFDPAA